LIFLSIEIKQTFNIGYISLCKESLNSDEHQFHQYQQNEQSPLISIYLTQEKDHNIYWYQLTSLPQKTKKKKPQNILVPIDESLPLKTKKKITCMPLDQCALPSNIKQQFKIDMIYVTNS
jgi:hypothetical protein